MLVTASKRDTLDQIPTLVEIETQLEELAFVTPPIEGLSTLRAEVADHFSNRIATVRKILSDIAIIPAKDMAKWQKKISEAQNHIPHIKLKVRGDVDKIQAFENLELERFAIKLSKYSEYLEHIKKQVEVSNSNRTLLTNLRQHITSDIINQLKRQIKNPSTPIELKPKFQSMLDSFVTVVDQIKETLTRKP
jgi:nitrate/TMAO reductase-like tetraheme cytochrome c subunit